MDGNIEVFVSSAQREFEHIRIELEQKINAMPYLACKLLEKRGAQPENTEKASLSAVSKCDIYLGILGDRYSILTIKEYRRAHKDYKPILIYIKKDANSRDAKLKEFIEIHVKNNYKYEKFSDAEDLCRKVSEDLKAYLLSLLREGINGRQLRRKKGKEAETKQKPLVQRSSALKHGVSADTQILQLLENARKQYKQGMLVESIINSAFVIELSLRKKLAHAFPTVLKEPIGLAIQYAHTSQVLSEDLIDEIRKLQYLRNEITHTGVAPSKEAAKSALQTATMVTKTIEKSTVQPSRWVASYSVNTNDYLEAEEDEESEPSEEEPTSWALLTEHLKGELMAYLKAKGIKYVIEEDDGNGETYGIRISFDWDLAKGLPPIGDSDPWELMELEPYVKIYGEEPDD